VSALRRGGGAARAKSLLADATKKVESATTTTVP
jgi:hypothetical protein